MLKTAFLVPMTPVQVKKELQQGKLTALPKALIQTVIRNQQQAASFFLSIFVKQVCFQRNLKFQQNQRMTLMQAISLKDTRKLQTLGLHIKKDKPLELMLGIPTCAFTLQKG